MFSDVSQRIFVLSGDSEANLADECESLKSDLIDLSACSLTLGIGNTHRGIANISRSYREARKAVKYRIVAGKTR